MDRRIYLGVGGGALAFILRVLALQRATPTRVANTMTINPIAAGLLATQLVGEPVTANLVVGLVAVFAGIWIATTEAEKRRLSNMLALQAYSIKRCAELFCHVRVVFCGDCRPRSIPWRFVSPTSLARFPNSAP
jgi:hypothetical protein